MITYEQFKSVAGTPFKVTLEGAESSELLLKMVSEKKQSGPGEFFSIEFEGPKEPFLKQGIYEMEHSKSGMLSIFLVPVGETHDSFLYESVFNQIVEES